MSSLGYILLFIGALGVIGEGIYSITKHKEKLDSNEWGLKIFIPTFIFLLLIILGMYIIFKNNATEKIDTKLFYPLIIFMASGSIAYSSIIIVFSHYVVNWKSS
jgi:heme/copper-type cytochrome/quinol oxidase subunit 3